MRNGLMSDNTDGLRQNIPITLRQLEGLIRVSESLAKMRLKNFAGLSEVEEALRLFSVSTLDAALEGCVELGQEYTEEERHIEEQLLRRFPIGSQVSIYSLVEDFRKQQYSDVERKLNKVLTMLCATRRLKRHKYTVTRIN